MMVYLKIIAAFILGYTVIRMHREPEDEFSAIMCNIGICICVLAVILFFSRAVLG